MSKANLLPLEELTDNSGYSVTPNGDIVDTSNCPFVYFDDTPQFPAEMLCKVYNDGGHYIATPYFHSYGKRKSGLSPLERVFELLYNNSLKKQRERECCAKEARKPLDEEAFISYVLPILRARFPNNSVSRQVILDMIRRKKARLVPEKKIERKTARDIAFDSLYKHAINEDMDESEMKEYISAELLRFFPDEDSTEYVTGNMEKKKRNLFARKKRFRRKANINRWNYFVTFTYDDSKQDEESFRKKLRKCLSNMHTRRGWKYMGVFERAPETKRLHFHGLLYIPDGQMVGDLVEKEDYSTAQGRMQTYIENTFFQHTFGRNDFEELNMKELRNGHTLEYILKYIEKTGERVVYSRGIPSQVCKLLPNTEVVGKLQDFMTKYVLFDDTIDWERDVMRYKWSQMTIVDLICNPPRLTA